MDEFSSIGNAPMSSDETPKIEPTRKVADAPSIAPDAKPEAAEPAAPKIEATQVEAPKAETPQVEAKAAPENIEVKREPKIDPRAAAPTLPPAAQLAESAAIVRLKRRVEPKPEPIAKPSHNILFALLPAGAVSRAAIGR